MTDPFEVYEWEIASLKTLLESKEEYIRQLQADAASTNPPGLLAVCRQLQKGFAQRLLGEGTSRNSAVEDVIFRWHMAITDAINEAEKQEANRIYTGY